MTFVIAVTQQKGGAGKTTLVAHLGMAWMLEGRAVHFIDSDPQKSLTFWHRARDSHAPGRVLPPLSTVDGWKLPMEVSRVRRNADIILIDTPPHGETTARLAVREADMVLLPVQLSALDWWASSATLEMIRAEGRDYRVVLNRVPARGRAAGALAHEIKASGHPVARSTLGNRQAFAASLHDGESVLEAAPTSLATVEILALGGELARDMGF